MLHVLQWCFSTEFLRCLQSPSAAVASDSTDAGQSSSVVGQGWRGHGFFDTIRPSIYVKKEQRKHELENRLREQAAGGYNQMRRLHQKSLRQVGFRLRIVFWGFLSIYITQPNSRPHVASPTWSSTQRLARPATKRCYLSDWRPLEACCRP